MRGTLAFLTIAIQESVGCSYCNAAAAEGLIATQFTLRDLRTIRAGLDGNGTQS